MTARLASDVSGRPPPIVLRLGGACDMWRRTLVARLTDIDTRLQLCVGVTARQRQTDGNGHVDSWFACRSSSTCLCLLTDGHLRAGVSCELPDKHKEGHACSEMGLIEFVARALQRAHLQLRNSRGGSWVSSVKASRCYNSSTRTRRVRTQSIEMIGTRARRRRWSSQGR